MYIQEHIKQIFINKTRLLGGGQEHELTDGGEKRIFPVHHYQRSGWRNRRYKHHNQKFGHHSFILDEARSTGAKYLTVKDQLSKEVFEQEAIPLSLGILNRDIKQTPSRITIWHFPIYVA